MAGEAKRQREVEIQRADDTGKQAPRSAATARKRLSAEDVAMQRAACRLRLSC